MASFLSNTFALLQLSLFFFTLLNSLVVHGCMDSDQFLTVQGYVFCQSSKHIEEDYTLSQYSSPLTGVIVRVQCNVKETTLAQEISTNEKGNFTINLPKEYANFCHVHLIYSPEEKCSSPTNLNGGLNGHPLNYNHDTVTTDDAPMMISSSNVINVGPFAFVPDLADKHIIFHQEKLTLCDMMCNYNCGCCTCTDTDNCQSCSTA